MTLATAIMASAGLLSWPVVVKPGADRLCRHPQAAHDACNGHDGFCSSVDVKPSEINIVDINGLLNTLTTATMASAGLFSGPVVMKATLLTSIVSS